ncbi:hypothetical protein OS493_028966 [Desmophyllum pertusum]|uniref:Uncharacterized protein n=1 Tax=Desmophyllum pertusum TaxID=174260 RepID=A0A9W9YWU5_9CNID|nr:hypothetical protein OS493_028966 [Desmophyllum pertusum]
MRLLKICEVYYTMITLTGCVRFTFYAVLAAACLYLTSEGAATCYECNSRDDKSCKPESIDGLNERRCRSGEMACAVAKHEPPGNTSNHQYVRYCDRECKKYNTTYHTEGGTRKHCVLCCSKDLCNNMTVDPCNPSKAGRLRYETFTIALLGVPVVISSYFVVVLFIVLFMDVLVIEGLIKCHFCNSREGPCSTDTLQGTVPQTCTRWFNQCSLYRMVLPNGTTAQVVRGCDRDCRPVMKWTLGRYQKTSHCKFCCDSDLCNTHVADPCSKSSTSVACNILWLFVLVSLGLCAN